MAWLNLSEDISEDIDSFQKTLFDVNHELYRRRLISLRKAYHKWIEKGQNRAKRKVYMRTYNSLPELRARRIAARRKYAHELKVRRHKLGLGIPKPTRGSRITFETAEQIRSKFATGKVSGRALAREYGISSGTVSSIIRGKTYIKQVAKQRTNGDLRMV